MHRQSFASRSNFPVTQLITTMWSPLVELRKANRMAPQQPLKASHVVPEMDATALQAGQMNAELLRQIQSTVEQCTYSDVSVMWNQKVGGREVVPQYFAEVLEGFDITGCSIQPDETKPTAHGTMYLRHSRPFMGKWEPTNKHIACRYKVHGEMDGLLLSHLTFSCQLHKELLEAGCPEELVEAWKERFLQQDRSESALIPVTKKLFAHPMNAPSQASWVVTLPSKSHFAIELYGKDL